MVVARMSDIEVVRWRSKYDIECQDVLRLGNGVSYKWVQSAPEVIWTAWAFPYFTESPFDFDVVAKNMLTSRIIVARYSFLHSDGESRSALDFRLAWEPDGMPTPIQVDEAASVIEEEFRLWDRNPGPRIVLLQPSGWNDGQPV